MGVVYKYNKEILELTVKDSLSVQEVARKILKKEYITGGTHAHIKKMIKRYNIDTSHFLGYRHNLGKVSLLRRSPTEILVYGKVEKRIFLKRALIEIGRPYICEHCHNIG